MIGRRTFGFLPRASVSRHPNRASGFHFALAMFAFGLCGGVAFADSNDLRSRLANLATERGFAIEGLQWIGPEAAGNARGSVSDRLNVLLQDYNYVLIQDRLGGIAKVLITSRKSSQATSSASNDTVYTVRLNNHHYVDASIAGPSGIVRTVRFLIDTGATNVVLPASLIADLGFTPQDLRSGMGWGLGGAMAILVGRLRVVRVGAASVDEVQVSFVADEKLRGTMLLGMSFLQHFRVTIDDHRNELVLVTK